MHAHNNISKTSSNVHIMAWSGCEFEESMPSTRTQTTSRNFILLQTYICAAELATWGVGPDVLIKTS